MNPSSVGLYLHIPFCKEGKCPYCDFYSLPFEEGLADRYEAALLRAMAHHPFGDLCVDTVYFGGGTPLLMGERLASLLEGIRKHFRLAADAEITLEANPEGADSSLLALLRGAGFTRISFGVQSGIPAELGALGRRHTVVQAVNAVESAAKAGFTHISADLMLGIPMQTEESLRQSVDLLTDLPVDHISAYLLKIEEGTPFARQNLPSLPDEDSSADLYLAAVRLLEDKGFAQYEVSNFAKPGGESRHNLTYWRCEEYLGLGPAAHSYMGGQRFYFPRNLQGFLEAEDPFALSAEDGAGGSFEEYAMLRLRLREGLDLAELARRYPLENAAPLRERAAQLAPRGLLTLEEGIIRLTPEGFLLLGPITGHLLIGQ